jgi:hypothetical protein
MSPVWASLYRLRPLDTRSTQRPNTEDRRPLFPQNFQHGRNDIDIRRAEKPLRKIVSLDPVPVTMHQPLAILDFVIFGKRVLYHSSQIFVS